MQVPIQYTSEYSKTTPESGEGVWHDKIFLHESESLKTKTPELFQTEYFVDANETLRVLRIIKNIPKNTQNLISLVEVTPVEGGGFLMSPAKFENSFSICITWDGPKDEVNAAVKKFEQDAGRMFQGVDLTKQFGLSRRDLSKIYQDKIKVFNQMVKVMDPMGKLNDHFFENALEVTDIMEDL
jgi:hypothetical protein